MIDPQVAREFVVDAIRLYPRLHRFEESDWRTPTDRLYWQPSIDTDHALRTLAESPAFRAGTLRRVHVSDLDAVKFASPSTTPAVDTGVRCRCTRGQCVGCRCVTSDSGKCGPRCHLPKSLRSLQNSSGLLHDGDSSLLTCYSTRCKIAPVALGPTRLDARRPSKQPHGRCENDETLCRVWAYRRNEHFRVSRVVAYPTTMRNSEPRRVSSLPSSPSSPSSSTDAIADVSEEFHAAFQGAMLGARTEALVHSRGLARLVTPGSACIVTMGDVGGIRVATVTPAATADCGDRAGAPTSTSCRAPGCLCRTPWRTWDAALDPVPGKRATTTTVAGSETWVRTVSAAEIFTATVAAPAIAPTDIPLAKSSSSSSSPLSSLPSSPSPVRRRSSTRRRLPRST